MSFDPKNKADKAKLYPVLKALAELDPRKTPELLMDDAVGYPVARGQDYVRNMRRGEIAATYATLIHQWLLMDTRMTKRRNFSDKFKAAVALEALRGDKTVQEIAAKRQLHPTQVSTWKRQAIEGMASVFSDKVKKAENKDGEIKELHAKIGKLAVENDFLSQGLKR